jgi:hypothetical protein
MSGPPQTIVDAIKNANIKIFVVFVKQKQKGCQN